MALWRAPYELGVKTDVTVSFIKEIVQENPLASYKSLDTAVLMPVLGANSLITTSMAPIFRETSE